MIETYIKAIRKERWLLETNVLTLLIAILSTIVSVFILQNLTLAVISIVVLLAFRCIRLEMKLTKEIHVAVYRDILLEIIMSITFIICSGSIQGFRGFLTYLIAYLSYLIVNRNRMQEVWITIKSISGNLLKKVDECRYWGISTLVVYVGKPTLNSPQTLPVKLAISLVGTV